MSDDFVVIGWIAHGMDKRKKDSYRAIFGRSDTRVPPKIYTTEAVAARYGTPVPVFIKKEHQPSQK